MSIEYLKYFVQKNSQLLSGGGDQRSSTHVHSELQPEKKQVICFYAENSK